MKYTYFYNRKHFFTGLILTAFVLLLFSCEEIMDVNLTGDSTRNLVVEGSITTDTLSHKVMLSYSGDYFERPDIAWVTDAEVTISDGTKLFVLHEDTVGVYLTDDTVHGEIGKTYTLNIKLADNSTYTATDYLNPCSAIDSITQSDNYNSDPTGISEDYGYDVLFHGQEPEPAGNYYMFLLYKNSVLDSDTITEVSFANDDFINGLYLSDLTVYRIHESALAQGPALITLEMHAVTRKYYEFMLALMKETIWKGSPWDTPPAEIPGNISNGAKGYFRASDVNRRSRVFHPTARMN
jgi:hypothetical protein